MNDKQSFQISWAEDGTQLAASIIAQLQRSERGRQALSDFRNLLDNGGDGLDAKNWNALASYCQIRASGRYCRL